MTKPKWLALGYTVPAIPSKARVYVWRTLKKLGAQSFKPTVAVLPNSAMHLKNFSVLADKIRQMDGEAWIVELNFLSIEDHEEMAERFRSAALARCNQLMEEISSTMERLHNPDQQSEQLVSEVKKIEKEYQRNFEDQDAVPFGQMESVMAELRGAITGLRNEMSGIRGIWNKMMGISNDDPPNKD